MSNSQRCSNPSISKIIVIGQTNILLHMKIRNLPRHHLFTNIYWTTCPKQKTEFYTPESILNLRDIQEPKLFRAPKNLGSNK